MLVGDNYYASLLIFLFHGVIVVSTDYKSVLGCPAQCSCYNYPRDGKSIQEWSSLKCSIISSEESFMEDMRLYDTEHRIVQLELSTNVTRLDSFFLRLDALEKLDLNNNGIEEIDDEAFVYLKNLRRLDLSHNKIKNLHKKVFEPLQFLERLKVNNNLIIHLYIGVFDHLISLKSFDISGNPLHCDCTITWVTKWARNNSIKLIQPPKCKSPPSMKGKPLRKLKLHCSEDNSWFTLPTGLELKPMHNQIVFEGDSLNLRCRSLTGVVNGEEDKDAHVIWSWKNKDPISYFNEIKIENRSFSESGFVESQLKIEKIQKSHSGDWYCHLLSDYGNHSTAISVIVLSDDSKYCPQIDTKNNKGTYYWPKTVVGFTIDLPCAIKQPTIVGSKIEPRAFYFCNEAGLWENLNTTYCPFVSETTRILEQFSQVNLSIAKGSVLDSAIKLRNFTSNGNNLTDAMDIVFITKTVENYLMFVKNEKELGYILVDIIATIMELHKSLLIKAQKESLSCSRLIQSVEIICKDIPTFQYHKSNIAVEEFGVTGMFSGITCIWYTNIQRDKLNKKFFHCATKNRTAFFGASDKIIEASIQIPSTLFSHLEKKGKSIHNIHKWQLILSMYENNNLFPGFTDSYEDVTSSVIGTKLVEVEVTNLTDPVFIMLRMPPSSHVTVAKPVWWDQSLYNGSGGWVEEGCELSHYTQGMVVFRCERFGYFGLLQDTRYLNNYLNRYNSNKPQICHPAIYTGSFILIVCLLINILTYLISHNFIQMSRRLKHSIVNTWVSILLLCFTFSCGIYQTENIKICQGVGIVIHYLFLSTLLWMSVSASNMYKRLSKSDSLENAPEDDLPPGVPIQKPILGLYLVGWGIGLIVCGISGAVNLKEYAGKNFCFLETGPALSAVFVPAGILLAFLTLFYILTLCAIRNNDTNGQLSEGTQGTENVDLELLEVPAPMTCIDRRSIQSIVTADSDNIEDPEHSPIIQLKAHIIVLLLYCFIWSSAALSLTDPFQSSLPYQDICSILYCILAFFLGTFILYFYCVARSDVRSQWTIVTKVFKGKHIHCCRSRNICDTQSNVQMTPSTNIPNGNSVCQAVAALSSSSVNSSGLTVKSNSHNSNRVKAVKKLNNCEAREDHVIRSITSNNVNLVAMHRQIYRSNNSMPTYHEITGPDCAEAFYNPRQSIVARKFFKKQRRNKRNDLGLRRRGDGGGTSEGEISQTRRTWRPSAESAVFLSSDMENANEKIGSNFLNYNSKANNTHIVTSNKLKKSHSPNKNQNILTDSDEENRNKLLLDRVVIGAKEDDQTFMPSKNNDHISSYDYKLSRVEEMSASEEICSSAIDTSKHKEIVRSKGSSNGVVESCHCQNDCSDSSVATPDYRTVELQCNLGENSYSDINSETNHCDCTNRGNTSYNEDDSYRASQSCLSCSDLNNETVMESGPDCNSFNEKIDKIHLHSESSSIESPHNKTDKYCSMPSSKKFKTNPSKHENELIKTNYKKSANRLSLPPHLDGECEIEALIDQNNSEKTKKETSV